MEDYLERLGYFSRAYGGVIQIRSYGDGLNLYLTYFVHIGIAAIFGMKSLLSGLDRATQWLWVDIQQARLLRRVELSYDLD